MLLTYVTKMDDNSALLAQPFTTYGHEPQYLGTYQGVPHYSFGPDRRILQKRAQVVCLRLLGAIVMAISLIVGLPSVIAIPWMKTVGIFVLAGGISLGLGLVVLSSYIQRKYNV